MKYRRANTDRISHLPSEIIEKILILLPCRDAVRTSILSSAWRYKWTSMSDLNFGEAWTRGTYKHANFIDKCLLLHQGPIRKFSVTARKLPVARKIEQWIKLVSKHDIEELELDFGRSRLPIRAPSCLFNCKKLTHLKLSNCLLDVPPTFEGFVNVKVLSLYRIEVKDKSSIESLISKCPLLESLSLLSMDSNIPITISAPKIKYLSLESDLKSIGLEKSPLLVDMILFLYGDLRECDLIKILGAAPNLEKLSVDLGWQESKHFKFGCCRGVLSTTFSYLKVMALSRFYLGESEAIPLVLELLRSTPNLEELVIDNVRSHCLPNKADPDFWEKEYLVGHCFMKLKVFELGYILVPCKAAEIEFVKFILSNSPFLEKMTIGTLEGNQEKLTRMLEELSTLPRASTQVAVTFHGGDSRWTPNCPLMYGDD